MAVKEILGPSGVRYVPMSGYSGYLASSSSSLASHHVWSASDLRRPSSDYLQNDVLPLRTGAYGLNNVANIGDAPGIGSHASSGFSGLTAGTSTKGLPAPFEDPILVGQRRDVTPGITTSIPDILPERSNFIRKPDGLPDDESNILFVDSLPNDCTRREVSHLFRPFIGFKDIKVIHKEPRKIGEKGHVLCFVEFSDSKCALTALEALQGQTHTNISVVTGPSPGYKFDDKKADAPVLRIHQLSSCTPGNIFSQSLPDMGLNLVVVDLVPHPTSVQEYPIGMQIEHPGHLPERAAIL
ncbi:hypothetical protein ACLOJK_033597 [Asimina triloba]